MNPKDAVVLQEQAALDAWKTFNNMKKKGHSLVEIYAYIDTLTSAYIELLQQEAVLAEA